MEATEKLVKLFLESKGFLVTTNYRYKVSTNKYPEVDIVAVRPKHRSDVALPDRLIGEVKSWSLYPTHFKETLEKSGLKSRDDSSRFKVINIPEFREACLRSVQARYGDGFQFCIFAREIAKKWEGLIRAYLGSIGVGFVSHKDVVNGVLAYAREQAYSNDSELQLIRLIEETGGRIASL